jgi:hypothetical protein
MLKDVEVLKDGIKLTFNFKLDDDVSLRKESYDVHQWNYKRTNKYGSAHYSAKMPGTEGIDSVTVNDVVPDDEHSSVVLHLSDRMPVNTMRIRFTVKGADGTGVRDVVYLTVNKLPE